MKKSVFLIQGIIFQKTFGFGFAPDEQNPKLGLRAMINPVIAQSLFSGFIAFDSKTNPEDFGELKDHWGDSVLSNIILTEKTLSFDKKYVKRNDIIHYTFEKQNDFWAGIYEGNETGKGTSRCILTEVSEAFMMDPGVALASVG